MEGKTDGECRASAQLTLHINPSPLGLCELLDQGKSDTRTLVFAMRGAVRLPEPLEQMPQVLT